MIPLLIYITAILFLFFHHQAQSLSTTTTTTTTTTKPAKELGGNWASAKQALRNPNCCVVSVSGLESHLKTLQKHFVENENVPADIDLRARVNVGSGASSTSSSAYNDCFQIRNSVLSIHDNDSNNNYDIIENDECTTALEELAKGVFSLTEQPLENNNKCQGVFIRIVCASNYKAIDPMFHTDKAPLRGYVTLKGVGTEYMTRPCSPLEYITLRTLGGEGIGGGKNLIDRGDCRRAPELEFIVMKGDYYQAADDEKITTTESSSSSSWLDKVWSRKSACVHRSPPNSIMGGRRVIISLDLADGDDDREWYTVDKKREWRSGMTQRKSRLVA